MDDGGSPLYTVISVNKKSKQLVVTHKEETNILTSTNK